MIGGVGVCFFAPESDEPVCPERHKRVCLELRGVVGSHIVVAEGETKLVLVLQQLLKTGMDKELHQGMLYISRPLPNFPLYLCLDIPILFFLCLSLPISLPISPYMYVYASLSLSLCVYLPVFFSLSLPISPHIYISPPLSLSLPLPPPPSLPSPLPYLEIVQLSFMLVQ